eukprot:762501-Hanusia_phi.AAC.1
MSGQFESGCLSVISVLPESPAAFSGQIGAGDQVEAVDGKMVSSLEHARQLLEGTDDTLVALEIRKNGSEHAECQHLIRQRVSDSSRPSEDQVLGMGIRIFHNERGMWVSDLYEGGSAYWSSLKVGDLICAIDGHDVRSCTAEELLRFTSGKAGTNVKLHIIRKLQPGDDVAGVLSARGLAGSSIEQVRWESEQGEPTVHPDERMIQIFVVRWTILKDDALKRALDYRSRVVQQLQIRIDTALSDNLTSGRLDTTSEWKGSENAAYSYLSSPGSVGLSWGDRSGPRTPLAGPEDSPSLNDFVRMERQLTSLKERQEDEMSKLQFQMRALQAVLGEDSDAAIRGDEHRNGDADPRYAMAKMQEHFEAMMHQQSKMSEELFRQIEEQKQHRKDQSNFRSNILLLNTKIKELELFSRQNAQEINQKMEFVRNNSVPTQSAVKVYETSGHNQVEKIKDSAVGISIHVDAEFDRVKLYEDQFSEDLISSCSWSVQASESRFVFCAIQQGSVIAILDIIPDPSGVDQRTCRELAEELAFQVAYSNSPFRKAPVTRPAIRVDIHEPQRSQAHTWKKLDQLPSASQRTDDRELLEHPQVSGDSALTDEWLEAQKRLAEMQDLVGKLAISRGYSKDEPSLPAEEDEGEEVDPFNADQLSVPELATIISLPELGDKEERETSKFVFYDDDEELISPIVSRGRFIREFENDSGDDFADVAGLSPENLPLSGKLELPSQASAHDLKHATSVRPTNFTETAAFVSPRASRHDQEGAISSQERKWRVLPQISQEQTPSVNSDTSFVNEGIIAVGTDRIDLEDVTSWQMSQWRNHAPHSRAATSPQSHSHGRPQEKTKATRSWSSDSDDSDDFYGQPTSLSLYADNHRKASARASAGGYRSFQQENAARMLDSETSDSDKN